LKKMKMYVVFDAGMYPANLTMELEHDFEGLTKKDIEELVKNVVNYRIRGILNENEYNRWLDGDLKLP
jgi:hypothetical protein